MKRIIKIAGRISSSHALEYVKNIKVGDEIDIRIRINNKKK
jgi:acyl-ACP thioesterase